MKWELRYENSKKMKQKGEYPDYGADPIGDPPVTEFRMVPSGDIVDAAERDRRLGKSDMTPVRGVFGRSWEEIERLQGSKVKGWRDE